MRRSKVKQTWKRFMAWLLAVMLFAGAVPFETYAAEG